MPLSSDDILKRFGGIATNDLNRILDIDDVADPDGEIVDNTKSVYMDSGELENYLFEHRHEFNILSLNTQSIRAKFDQIYILLSALHEKNLAFSAICIQESWLSDSDDIAQFVLPGYNLINQGWKCSKHGGLMIYIKDTFSYKLLNLYEKSDLWEGIFIDIKGDQLSKPITIGNIYRPPPKNNSNEIIESFINQFTPVIDKISKSNASVTVVGDFNIDLLKIQEKEKYEEFLDLMCTYGLLPKITLPTRFATKTCSLIDQIYCKFPNPNLNYASAVIKSRISDHLPCLVSINLLLPKKHNPKYINVRSVNEAQICQFLNEIRLSNIIDNIDNNLLVDPNITYDILLEIISKAREKYFPEKKVRFNKHKHKISEWITTGIIKSIEFRDNLYKKWKMMDPNSQEYRNAQQNLTLYNIYLNKIIKLAKKDYYTQQFEKYRLDIRKTWDTLKTILNKMKSKSVYPKTFFFQGHRITDMVSIANKFNEYYTCIGSNLANAIDTNGKPAHNTYLKNPSITTFLFTYTSTEEVLKLINNLKPKHSAGHDSISSKLLKKMGTIIAPSLTVIINQSLCTGIFPNKLKIAKVIPLYKKNDDSQIENYRPISLLSSISKLFERVVFNQLYRYMNENKLLFSSQYGFRKDHSTELAALELIDKIYEIMDGGDIPICIFLDLSKAFDTLDHNILLNKLTYYGIKDNAFNWFKSYLSERQQYVEIEGIRSNTLRITTGVPQGSILGPLLFLIYVNDMYTVSDEFEFIKYADDTTLISRMVPSKSNRANNRDSTSERLNHELQKITDWLAVNKLSLNVSKTNYMLFHFRQRHMAGCDIPRLLINGTEINLIDEFNFLGLTIDKHMSWSAHIKKISNKISRILGVMNRLKRILPHKALKLMYTSLISSHFQFGITTWGYQLSRLGNLQKRALRIMNLAKYNAHTEPLLKENKLLMVNDIFKLNCFKFYHRYINGTLPTYFKNIFTRNSEIHSYETRNKDNLHYFPFNRIGASERIRHSIPNLIDESPEEIKIKLLSFDLKQFTIYYKNRMIDNYEEKCNLLICHTCGRL